MSHLNITFDQYASIGTVVLHCILVKSEPETPMFKTDFVCKSFETADTIWPDNI